MDNILDQMRDRDRFGRLVGIELLGACEGSASVRLAITEKHLNGLDIAHGGAVFTLADIAFAAASNSRPGTAVSVSSSISIFQATRVGDVLTAAATELSLNRKLATYRVEVTNAAGVLVASFLGTVYRKEGMAGGGGG